MSILTVTLNPALDVSTTVPHVESGTKLRCETPRFDPGGGGINVSRAIAKMGSTSQPFIAIGGATGEMLKDLLRAENIEPVCFDIGKPTRESLSVYEESSGKQFRFVLPGPEWTELLAETMLAAFSETLVSNARRIDYVVASGSLPPGLPDDFYGEIAKLAARHGARIVLDTSGAALEVAANSSDIPPYLWIMDQTEAEQTGGQAIGGIDDLEGLATQLRKRGLASIIVATLAEGGAVAVSEEQTIRLKPPKVDVLSKVGAGDSFVAGLVLKLAKGAPLREACAYAVAAAASAVTTPATELCSGAQTDRYFDLVLSEN